MGEKMKFGEIRKDIKNNKEVNEENEQLEWIWDYYDSSLLLMGSSFSKVLPEEYVGYLNKKIYTKIEEFGEAFKKYIEDTLSKNKNKERTAIEFGGPGSQLFAGFTPGFFEKTVGVCLDDIRFINEKEDDKLIDHSVIVGDVTDINNKNLFNEINDKLGTSKVDLIISRLQGPLRELKRNPAFLDRIIRKWYSMLDKNGILFAQFEYLSEHNPNMEDKYNAEITPPPKKESEKYVEEWVLSIHNKLPNQIEIQLGRGVIRITKKEGAPEELPSIKELFND